MGVGTLLWTFQSDSSHLSRGSKVKLELNLKKERKAYLMWNNSEILEAFFFHSPPFSYWKTIDPTVAIDFQEESSKISTSLSTEQVGALARLIGSKLLPSECWYISKAPPAAALLHASASPPNQESGNEGPTGSPSLLSLFKLSLWRAFRITDSARNSGGTQRSHLISRRCLQRFNPHCLWQHGEGGRWWW